MSVMEALSVENDRRQLPRAQMLVTVQVTWMAVLFTALHIFGTFTVENYYILSYFGLVVVAGVFAPLDSSPRWWRTISWLIRLGFIGLCYFVAQRVMDVLQV